MKRLAQALLWVLALWAMPAMAQVPCIGVGSVNNVPQVGIVCKQEPGVNSYAATGIAVVPPSAATDLSCITGGLNVVARIQQVRVSGTAGTLINVPTTITKHATANTGGTPATGTALPVPYRLDSTDSAPVATTTAWTANPTITDAAPGLIDTGILVLTATGTLAGNAGLNFDWSERQFIEAPTLRGVAQQLCINLNATSISSGVVNVVWRWTEAPQ
jgi:hypothetical protein